MPQSSSVIIVRTATNVVLRPAALSAGAIAGITIGVLIALCCIGIILCCAVCYCVYRNKSGSSSHYVTTPSYPLAQHISTATATVSNTGSSSSLYTYTNKMTTAAYPLAPPTSTATAANNTDNNMIEKFGIPAGPQQPPRPYPFGNQYSSPNAIPLPKTVAPKAPYSSGNASTAAPHSRQ